MLQSRFLTHHKILCEVSPSGLDEAWVNYCDALRSLCALRVSAVQLCLHGC